MLLSFCATGDPFSSGILSSTGGLSNEGFPMIREGVLENENLRDDSEPPILESDSPGSGLIADDVAGLSNKYR